jgi:hypothetical protein
MKIKVKKIGIVDVSCEKCPKYDCFSPHHYQHRQQTMDGETISTVDKELSCSYRNYNGCPDNPTLKVKKNGQ